MKRRLFDCLSGISLLLCVSSAAMWTATLIIPGALPIIHLANQTEIWFEYHDDRGGQKAIALVHLTPSIPDVAGDPRSVFYVAPLHIAPYWIIVLLAGFLPAVRTIVKYFDAREQAYKLRFGLCMSCGYDLRGTPDRCPECGAIPKKNQTDPRPIGH